MNRSLFALMLCLLLAGCAGGAGDSGVSGGSHSGGTSADEAWRSAQLAELRELPTPEGVDPALWSALKSRFEDMLEYSAPKTVLAAPSTPASAPRLNLDTESLTLSWGHSMQGDYSQDREVGISDLTPLGQHFNESSENGGPFPYNSLQAVIDGDGNGQINISDISPIGGNFGRRTLTYNVYASNSFEDVPTSPDGPNGDGAELMGSVDFTAATGEPGAGRLQFSFVLEEAKLGWFYWVRPADGASEGTPSNAVSFGANAGNASPTAVLTAEPLSGAAPLEVQFDASGSFDFDGAAQDISDIVQFSWDFEGDGQFDAAGSEPQISHTYSSEGQFEALVLVTDAQAGIAADTVTISVGAAGNQPPVASFTADPLSATAPVVVTFDDSATTDDGGAENLLYEWDFNGDGFVDLSTDSEAVIEQFYAGGGDFIVDLTVTDQGGLSDSFQVALNIEGDPVNQPPVAILEVDVTEGPVPLEVTFDFSDSVDIDGQIVLYELDLDGGDNGFEVTLEDNPQPITHTYETGGLFKPLLRVTDNEGAIDSIQLSVLADDGNNLLPLARFLIPGFTSGTVPFTTTFDASSSLDSDGDIVLYEWDFEGEGDFSFQTTQAVTEHTYTTGGFRVPVLRVTDNEGGTDEEISANAISVSNPNNQPPVAQMAVTLLSADFPQEYQFDASASSDPDGEVEKFFWDFDGDGQNERITTEAVTTFSYHANGTYTPELTAQDNEDESSSVSGAPIVVTGGWQSDTIDELTSSFPGGTSLAVVKDKDVTRIFTGYVDKPGGTLGVAFAPLDDPLNWTLVAVEVAPDSEPSGNLSLISVESTPAIFFNEQPAEGNSRVRYVRAQDIDGSAWSVPQTVAESEEFDNSTLLASRMFASRPAVAVDAEGEGLLFFRADDEIGASWTAPAVVIAAGGGDSGSLGIASSSVATANSSELLFYRATDNSGSGWGSPVLVNAADSRSTIKQLGLGSTGGIPSIGFVTLENDLAFVRAQDTSGSAWNNSVLAYDATGEADIVTGALTFGIRGGLPALVCQHNFGIMYVEALDANGSAWGEAEFAAIEGTSLASPSASISNSGIVIVYTVDVGSTNELRVAFRD